MDRMETPLISIQILLRERLSRPAAEIQPMRPEFISSMAVSLQMRERWVAVKLMRLKATATMRGRAELLRRLVATSIYRPLM